MTCIKWFILGFGSVVILPRKLNELQTTLLLKAQNTPILEYTLQYVKQICINSTILS